jgi:hypothetical protein
MSIYVIRLDSRTVRIVRASCAADALAKAGGGRIVHDNNQREALRYARNITR